MAMGVDQPGQDVFAGSVDDPILRAFGPHHGVAAAKMGDPIAFDRDYRARDWVLPRPVDQGPVLDQQTRLIRRHRSSLPVRKSGTGYVIRAAFPSPAAQIGWRGSLGGVPFQSGKP